MSKIILLDVDGTLVNYSGQLPESAGRAVKEARKNGHKVYIVTGRSRAEVYDFIWEIGLDGMIGGNGSYVEDQEEVVFHQVLSREDCKRIVDHLHEKGLEFYLECNSGLYASENFRIGGLEAIQEYSARKGKKDAKQMTIDEAFPDMIYDAELVRDDVNKISYVLNSYDDYLSTKLMFSNLQNGTWGGAGETALFGDVGVAKISKANAIERLLTHIGASKEDTIAFGDAKIDIPMFEYCNYSVCMGNGGPETKEAADEVCGDVDQDGLYHAFVKLGLIG